MNDHMYWLAVESNFETSWLSSLTWKEHFSPPVREKVSHTEISIPPWFRTSHTETVQQKNTWAKRHGLDGRKRDQT